MKYCLSQFAWTSIVIWMAAITVPSLAQDATASRLRHAVQFLSAGNLDRAAGELESVLRSSPNEQRALDLLNVVRILQHRKSKTESLFQQTIQNKPDFTNTHAHINLLYQQSNRDTKAILEL